MKIALYLLPVLVFAAAAQGSEGNHSRKSKYAGEENRSIKSLSPDDIAELRRGGGWGLAKTAELNGVPGPAHLLEMKNETLKDEIDAISDERDIIEQNYVNAIENCKAFKNKLSEDDENFYDGLSCEQDNDELIQEINPLFLPFYAKHLCEKTDNVFILFHVDRKR